MPVTEDVYREYKRPQWREAKQKKVRQMREFSLEYMTENRMEHIYSDNQKLVEEIAEDNLMLERKVSKSIGVPQRTINSRRQAIIKKLKKIMNL